MSFSLCLWLAEASEKGQHPVRASGSLDYRRCDALPAGERARFITQELGGDYLFGLKGNQSGILDQARRLPQISAAIRGHWSGSENGTHYRRDVTFGEDACRTANRKGAAVLASFRNLAIGIFELQREQKPTAADSLRSWRQQQTFTTVWPVLNR